MFIKTFVPGLDEILKGGIRQENSTLIIGAPGTGKSILGMQIICNIAKNGTPVLYISSDETIKSLREYMHSLNFPVKTLEKQGTLVFKQMNTAERMGRLVSMDMPMNVIKKHKIKVVVLDSLTLFEYIYSTNIQEFRRGVLGFIEELKQVGVSFIATSERDSVDLDRMKYKNEDFIFDTIISLAMVRKGSSFERLAHVIKSRGHEHMIDVFPFTISKGGISIFPTQIPFSLIEKEATKK